jgi:hypothetical protein
VFIDNTLNRFNLGMIFMVKFQCLVMLKNIIFVTILHVEPEVPNKQQKLGNKEHASVTRLKAKNETKLLREY